MLGSRPIVITVPDADFHLALPEKRDFLSWRSARSENEGHLQPFEPVWADDALTRKAFHRYVRFAQDDVRLDRGLLLLLKLNASDQVIGGINLRNIRRGAADAGTIGYWMAQEFGKAGRMKKAVAALVAFGFRQMGLHRIEAACVPDNHASAAILLGNGFEEEGFAKSYLRINGEWRDHRLFAIVAPESRTGYMNRYTDRYMKTD